jgi:peptide/nickel transport system permease protein
VLLAVAIAGALGPGISNSADRADAGVRAADRAHRRKRHHAGAQASITSKRRACLGADAYTIIRVHVLGNVLGPVFVYATGLISVSMILASGLSFLGLGVKPPQPEWGLMLNTLRTAIYSNPLVAALPGAMIFITSIAFNLLADGLRSAMDIRK